MQMETKLCVGVARVESCPEEADVSNNLGAAVGESASATTVKVKWMHDARIPFDYMASIFNAHSLTDSLEVS